MAQLIDDFDKKDNTTAPTDSSHGALKDDFGDTSAASDKPSIWQRAKSLFTSKPKTITVQPDEAIPDKEPPRKGSDLRDLYDNDPVMQGKGTPKQMTVTPEQDGILTRAAKSIQKHLGAQTNEGLVGIHDKELSFRQGSASDFYPEISAGTKESVNKLQEGEKTLATSKQKLEAWLPPPELKATSAKINTIKKQLDDISVHAVDNKLPSDLYKKYTTLRDQHKAEVKKYNDLLKNTKGDYQAQVAEYTKQVNEFNARKLRLSIATPDEEEKPSLIQHIARSVGVDKALGMDKETSIKRREDIENAQAAVELTGGKQEDDETLMQLIKFAGNESALGLPKAILEAQGEKWEEPKTTQEKVAAGAGTLIGFIYGAPGKITNLVEKGVVNLYPKLILRGTDSALIKGAKEAAYKLSGSVAVQNTVGLAAGFSSAAIGEALSKDNVDDAFKVLVKAAGFGAVMGGTFAGVKGAIPGEAPLDKIKRIATGLAIFDLERGNQPFDERKLNDKIMDYGMDAYFLWHGLPNQERGLIVDSMDDILTKLNNKTDLSNEEVRKIWKNNPEKRKELLKKYAGVKEQPIVDDFEPETTKEAQNAIKEGEKINQPEHTGINGELQQDGQNRNVGAGKQGEGAEAGDSNKPIPSKKKEVRPATEIIDDLDKVAPEEAVSKGNEAKAEEKPEEKPILPPEEKKAAEAKPEAKPVAKEPIWDEEEWRKQDRRRTQIAIDMLGKEDQRTATEDRRKPEPAAKVEKEPIAPIKKAGSDAYKVSPEIKEVPLNQITLSKDVPQFKSGASDKGIIEPLASKSYDRLPTNPIVLWERKGGALEIITGRHRYDLAQRTGEKTIPAQIVKESDGFTTQDALTFDAEQNIKDNQGSDFDYANYFRNREITKEEAKSRGILREERAKSAWILGKSATDSTFNAYRTGQIKFKQGAAIVKAAPKNEALQNEGLRYLLNEGSKANELETENYIKAISQFEATKPADQGDLFGYDDSAIRTAVEMSKKVSKIQNALRKDAANINATIQKSEALQLTPEAMEKYGITDGKDKVQLKEAHQKILADIDKWDKWATNPELVAQLKGEKPQFPLKDKGADESEKSKGDVQPNLAGLSPEETFTLDNPETEWSKPLSKQAKPKQETLFATKDIDKTGKKEDNNLKGEQNGRDEISGLRVSKPAERRSISDAVHLERERRTRKERQILGADEKTPKLLQIACRKGQGIKHYPEGYDHPEYENLNKLAASQGLELIPITDTTNIVNGFIRDGRVFLNMDESSKGGEPLEETLLHEIGHHLRKTAVGQSNIKAIDTSSPAVNKYYETMLDQNGGDITIADAVEEFTADLEAGAKVRFGVNLLEGIKEGKRVFTVQEVLDSKGKKDQTNTPDSLYLKAAESGDMKTAQKMVDDAAKAAGYKTGPIIHGTTHKFTVFSTEKANIENDFGKGYYFTTTEEDAENNYAGVGPDLTSRIERRAEQIYNDLVNDMEQEPKYNTAKYKKLMNKARKDAQKELSGGKPRQIKAYVKLDNPLTLGDRKTEPYWDYTYDEDTEEEGGELVSFINSLRTIAWDYGDIDVDKAIGDISDPDYAASIIDKARESEGLTYATDDEGNLAISEVIRRVIEEMGYDGIVDKTVNAKFGSERRVGKSMAGMDKDTYHVIAFKPEQIKSSDPVTYDDKGKIIPLSRRFQETNPDIRFSRRWKDVEGLTDDQKEARSRIERDVKILSVNAKEEGKTLAEYLKDIGLDDARAKRLLDYAKVQPVEYPGYKEVGEGEALEPGADVIMDMATGKNFVKIPETTGIKKAVKTAEREARGLEEVESEVKRVIPSFEEGKRLVDSEERDPRLLAESIAGGERKGMLEDQEVAMLLYDAMRISNDITDVNDALEEAILDGDKVKECELRLQHAKLLEDLNTNDIAVKRGGTEWSAVGRMYQQIIKEDYSLAKTLQRARIEYGDKLPREIEDKITELTRQMEDAQKKLKEYDEKAAVEAAKKEIQRIKSEPVIRQYIYKAKERQAETKDEILAERERIISAFNKTLSQLHFMFDPTAVKYLAEWTRNLVKDGLNTVEDITDEIYRVTEANHPELGITKRDIRDAISGYGRTFELSRKEIDVQLREIKRQARLISAYEDALSKQVPLRSGMQRDPLSDKVREMGRQVRQAMREAGIDSLSTRTPEEQWKTSLDAVKTRLKNQIADLTKQLEIGKKTPKKIGIEYDEEANALKEERDSLSAALAEIEGKPQMSPEQKIKMAMAAVEKSIAEYDRRIKENDLTPQKKVSTTPVTPELKAMREKRDQLKEIYKGMQDEAKPKLTPEQVYTNHLEKRKTDLEEKLRTKNFAKKPRRTYNLDERGLRLKGDIEGLKRQINIQIKRIELENRPKFEKDLDLTVRARRAVIFTSSTIFLKLSAAATARFVLEPIRNIIIGGTLYHVPGLKTLMRESPTEGGGYMTNIRAERARLARLINKNTWIDSWDMLTKGYNTLSVLDKGEQAQVRDWLDIPAHAHGAIKEPVKQGGYFAARVKYTQYCLENNLDPTNPVIEQMINAASMFYAKRQIFMNDNIVNDLYKSGLRMVERKGIGGKVATTFVRVELPVTKVPSNIFLEVGDMAVGLPKGLSQTLYHMLKSGAWEKLNPDQKDNIARSLKNGLLGLAIFGIAFYLFKNGDKPVRAGGFYRQGAKRKITDPQPDELRIGDVNIPKPLLHNTALITFQAAWTLFTVQEQYEKEMKAGGTWAGTAAAVMGLGQTLPFLDEPARMAKAMKNQDTAAKMAAEQLRGLVLPPDVPRIAKMIDTDVAGQPVARKPETAGDVFKMAIPGLRQQVPENTKKEKTDLKAKLIDDLRNDEPDAKENLDEAKSEGQITKTEKKEIKKEAKEDTFIASMKHLSLQEMAKRIEKNATPEQKEALYPVFKKKFFKERKDLDDDTKQKYLDLLDDMR